MTDHSWQKIVVDGLVFDTNGINMVRLHGVTIQYGTRTHKRVLETFKAAREVKTALVLAAGQGS